MYKKYFLLSPIPKICNDVALKFEPTDDGIKFCCQLPQFIGTLFNIAAGIGDLSGRNVTVGDFPRYLFDHRRSLVCFIPRYGETDDNHDDKKDGKTGQNLGPNLEISQKLHSPLL